MSLGGGERTTADGSALKRGAGFLHRQERVRGRRRTEIPLLGGKRFCNRQVPPVWRDNREEPVPARSLRLKDDGEQAGPLQARDQQPDPELPQTPPPGSEAAVCIECGGRIRRDDIVCPHCGIALVAG